MAFKLILMTALLFFFPPFVWLVTRRRSRLLRFGLLTVWLGGILVSYPVVTFTWAQMKIQPVYDSDCTAAIQLSRRYMKLPYLQFQVDLIGELIGFTPKYFYLSTIALCKSKMGNTKEAVRFFQELRTYCLKSPYDRDELENVSKALNRLRQKLKDSEP